MKEFSERFPELVKSDIFEWYHPERDTENPKRGCHNSHKKILEISKSRGYNKIITFEDDANLLVSWNEFVNIVNKIIYPDDWKIIQLGYFPFTTSKLKNNNTLVQLNCSICMHCYISNVKTLIIPDYSGTEIDRLLLCPNFKNYFLNHPVVGMYGTYPKMLIRQNSGESTIDSVRNNQGSLNYNRDHWLIVTTHMNYGLLLFFTGLIIIFLFLRIK
jgi:hypothetical protein